MADGSVTGAAPRGRAVPRRAVAWVLAVVVLAAVAGALVPVVAPPLARAETVAQVVVQPVPAGADPVEESVPSLPLVPPSRDDAVATVLGLARTPAVRDAVAARAGTTPDAVRDGLAVGADPGADGFVDVRADAPTAAQAGRVAGAAVDVLAAELERTDTERLRATLAPLDAQAQDLAARLRATAPTDPGRGALTQQYAALAAELASRTASPSPRLLPGGTPATGVGPRPSPVATAALAGLAALVLAVPAAALAGRPGRGRRAGTDPAHELAASVPGMRSFLVWSDDAPAVLTRFWVGVVRGRGPVLVLQLGERDRLDLAGALVAAGRLVGDEVVQRDLTPGAPAPAPISGRALVVSTLRTPTVDGAALAAARRAAPAVVLAVDTAHATRSAVASAVTAMRILERDVRGIVVWRGRLPRDPAGAPPRTRERAGERPGSRCRGVVGR